MGVFDGLPAIFTGTFGQAATVTPAGGVAREITVIFVSETEVDGLSDFGTVTRRTRISARTADVSDLKPGDAVQVDGRFFIAAAPVPDEHGMTTIPLKKRP